MGVVYPHITIRDTEIPSLLQLDATNNTVLVPMPYVQRYYDSEGTIYTDPSEDLNASNATLFMDANSFIKNMSSGGGKWKAHIDKKTDTIVFDEPEDNLPRYFYTANVRYVGNSSRDPYNVSYTPEKSYLMVIELLKRGLPVLVKPFPILATDKIKLNSSSKKVQVDSNGNIETKNGTLEFAYDDDVKIAVADYKALFQKVDYAISTLDAFGDLTDKNIYNFKFITSGGYPNLADSGFKDDNKNVICSQSYKKLAELASNRGDAIAILELKEDIYSKSELLDIVDVKTDTSGGVPETISSNFDKYKTSAAFTPWCEFSIEKMLPSDRKYTETQANKFDLSELTTMPAGFAYLMAYAYSIQTNATWFAAAGVNRGQIPQMVRPLFEIGDSFMEELQGRHDENDRPEIKKIRLNPIMNTGSYGYRIWGNRVAAPYKDPGGMYKTMYIEFLNVRMLLCDIKKQVYAAAIRTTFEPNDDITWVSFKVLCNNLLDRMKSGRGVLWYRWTKLVSEERATIKARLTIRPIEAVEAFDITVFLSDQDAEIEE